ncbi:hypothetical protein CMV_017932 [Castanea mollissima]|uniref:Uncharacterized protein n=1 Tax=Castanea mollissima TaxID=60419 RepID=A0A8J4R3J9_9ROSI|nr:hypothetical protein CMV_017932 [Castanea mollissima]
MMSRIPRLRSLQSLFLFCLISLQFISGFANDSPSTKDENNAGSHGASGSSKKKRAEQHARLLKLFEDDDELEVELGIRD